MDPSSGPVAGSPYLIRNLAVGAGVGIGIVGIAFISKKVDISKKVQSILWRGPKENRVKQTSFKKINELAEKQHFERLGKALSLQQFPT